MKNEGRSESRQYGVERPFEIRGGWIIQGRLTLGESLQRRTKGGDKPRGQTKTQRRSLPTLAYKNSPGTAGGVANGFTRTWCL